jgi:acetate kinase
MKILVLNSGSSSQKSALFELGPESGDDAISPLWEGKLEWSGDKERLRIRNTAGEEIHNERQSGDRQVSVETMLRNLWSGPTAVLKSASEMEVAGHRIVHGGPKLTQPVRVTPEVKKDIEDVAVIAPTHNQAGLQGIELVEKLLPDIPQIAVFDTGFHRTLPPEAFVYPVPYSWYESGIRRYGFHGINHEYCAQHPAKLLGRATSSLSFKVISCHLGNGCSLAAIDGGKSVDTTMGFTPLEGLMMGTRAGSVDPGILIHWMRTGSSGAQELDRVLNHESGLIGISGVSSDMHAVLEAMQAGDKRAQLAFDVFVHRLQAEIGAMAASLGGLDVLVFTAGIGENSPEVRQAACSKLSFLGVQLDDQRNSSIQPDGEISSFASKVRVLVIRAQEDWAIARACSELVPA